MTTTPERERLGRIVREALNASMDACARCKTCEKQDEAVMAVIEAEVSRLHQKVAGYENATLWDTSCTSCATVLDSCATQTFRAERAEDEATGLRTELEHAKAALAGDNEGIRLWMIDCGHLVEKHRDHAAEVSVKLGKIRELAASWTEADGWGDLTREMAIEAECARQILAIINGAEPDDGERP